MWTKIGHLDELQGFHRDSRDKFLNPNSPRQDKVREATLTILDENPHHYDIDDSESQYLDTFWVKR